MYNFDNNTPRLPDGIKDICSLVITDNAAMAQDEIFLWLLSHGWHGQKEYPMPYYDGKKIRDGRIDIVVFKGEVSLAIEVDARNPRKKSIMSSNNRILSSNNRILS